MVVYPLNVLEFRDLLNQEIANAMNLAFLEPLSHLSE